MAVRIRAVSEPFETADAEAAREAIEALLLADAMGLLGEPEIERLDLAALRRVARAAAEAGIGALPTALTARRVRPGELHAILRALRAALEDSPTPTREWAALLPLFGVEDLARLLGVAPVSIRRYASGARPTPDPVAARLHFLARVVAELKGAYNDVGVRRWFQRRRTALGGKAPAQVLTGDWGPEDRGARKVLELARSLAFSPAT